MSEAAALPLTDGDIYERVVSAILDHRLPPGTKLVEDKLATAFGVSRTRIRPVLVRLANEQVVTLTPHRGATITQPTEQEAREVFEVRRMIEPTLVALFIANASDADMAQLKALHRRRRSRAPGRRHAPRHPAVGRLSPAHCRARQPPDAGPHPARADLAHFAHPDGLQPAA